MSESTDNISSRAVNRAADLKQRVKRDSKQRIDKGKRAAADQIEDIADALDVAGSRLDQSQPTLANYASRLADGVGSLATRLREDNIEDLYRDARRFATEHPGMFLLGGAAVGLAIARFMKAEVTDDDRSELRSDLGEDVTQSSFAPEVGIERSERFEGASGSTPGV